MVALGHSRELSKADITFVADARIAHSSCLDFFSRSLRACSNRSRSIIAHFAIIRKFYAGSFSDFEWNICDFNRGFFCAFGRETLVGKEDGLIEPTVECFLLLPVCSTGQKLKKEKSR